MQTKPIKTDHGKFETQMTRSVQCLVLVLTSGASLACISDLAKFIAALVRGDGLSRAARAEMVKPSLHIGTAHQFPNFAPYLPQAEQRSDLAAGLGMIVFEGAQGR